VEGGLMGGGNEIGRCDRGARYVVRSAAPARTRRSGIGWL